MASGIPTRRTRRIDENAPPALGPRTRSANTIATSSANAVKSTTATHKNALTTDSNAATAKSSIPVMKRAASTTAAAAPSKASAATTGARSRAALGDRTNAAKQAGTAGEKGKEKMADKKPSASQSVSQAQALAARRARDAAVAADKAVKVEKPAVKRKATTTTTTRPTTLRQRSTNAGSASSTGLRPAAEIKSVAGRSVHVPVKQKEVEPARKRRKTSSPPVVDEEDLVDDAQYDDDGKEILLSSGGRAVGMKSPKRARAKDEGWEDLDAEDEGDPTMVSEYVVDAFRYMMSLEVSTMPNPNYMQDQAELQWKMRTILMDWLIEVHSKFRLLPETLFIAINLIDRFLSKRVISLVKFQLVGLTALFVAAKYEEVICPSISHFLHMTDGGYGVEEILKAERYMLSTIGFDLSYPNPLHFLRRISKADGYDIQSRTVGKFLVEISAVEHKLIAFPPSQLAAAGMWLARFCLERGSWDANLVHYSCYSVEELIEPAQIMLDYLLDPKLDTTTSFFKKYASKKHMKASVFMQEWARKELSAGGRWSQFADHEIGTELYVETGIPVPPHRVLEPED